MDFIVGLPVSKGKAVIMVVVDHLSKYAHFVALPAHFSAIAVAAAFVQEITRLHDIPSDIVSDRDPRFLSEFGQEVNRLHGTTLSMSTSYHPQADGQSKALNKCLKMYLRCYVADNPKAWVPMLPWAEFWYNTAFQTSAWMIPFEALYGRPLPTVPLYIRDASGNPLVNNQLLDRDHVLATLKRNLQRAQHRMKLQVDKHRREIVFEVEDWVYVKIQPFRQQSIHLRRHSKLGRKYFGPYQILARIGEVAYKLALPDSARIHPVFHVSLLKKCVGIPEQQITPIHLVDLLTSMVLHPVGILASRSIHCAGRLVDQWLVQWEGLPESEASWKDKRHLLQLFPSLNLEDKVRLPGGGNVMREPNHKKGQSNEEAQSNKESIHESAPAVRRSFRTKKALTRLDL